MALKRMKMKTLYIDMDNVLVDFQSGIDSISEEERTKFKNDLDDVPLSCFQVPRVYR